MRTFNRSVQRLLEAVTGVIINTVEGQPLRGSTHVFKKVGKLTPTFAYRNTSTPTY